MLSFANLVFDDIITGTGKKWYTSASFNDLLGSADVLTVHAITTDVSGTAPKLTCLFEHSGNAKDWINMDLGIVNEAIADHGTLVGSVSALTRLAFTRVEVSMGVSSGTPRCRLKLYALGFAYAARTTVPALKMPGGCGCP
jgi:hypothetical protein